MPRKGRDFEILVRCIESCLCPEGATVKSPDYLTDVTSGEQTEVDISIRSVIGSAEILVIIECRDRAGKQDKRWIDEIDSKKRSVNANKAIAVSRDGFTAPAINKAKSFGIDIRVFSEVGPTDFLDWIGPDKCVLIKRHVQINSINVFLKEREMFQAMQHITVKSNEKTLYCSNETVPFSVDDILKSYIQDMDNKYIEDWKFPHNKKSDKAQYTINKHFTENEKPVTIEVDSRRAEVSNIVICFETWHTFAHPKTFRQYTTDSDALAESVEFDVPCTDGKTTVPMSLIIDCSTQTARVAFRSPSDADKVLDESRKIGVLLETKES